MLAERLDHFHTALLERSSAQRIVHVLGACHSALELAVLWKCDAEAALTAAFLHDIAKEMPTREMETRLRAAGALTPDDENHPGIWHALASEVVAREDFGVADPAIGRAIRLHPTSDGEMSVLDQVLFLADYLEPSRQFDGIDELRALARRDLPAAVDRAVLRKTDHVASLGRTLHARSLRAREAALARAGRRQDGRSM
ncbi:bis(5'-nucleosyl)-tetraphosphatase (symmetrical) YqeK [Candidatus Sumerlaeota bacterium]|nr:bis(5'-nucleosyl)-tetraphosphatase (symmetrical) YqeK [Candidatus Sumerlaeota bacterium]